MNILDKLEGCSDVEFLLNLSPQDATKVAAIAIEAAETIDELAGEVEELKYLVLGIAEDHGGQKLKKQVVEMLRNMGL